MKKRERIALLLGTLTALFHLLGLFCLHFYLQKAPGQALGCQLVLWLLSGACWLGGIGVLRQLRCRGALLGCFVGLGLLMRLPALAMPVVHSGDVYRYLWDGAVQGAGLNPYAESPEGPSYAPVRAAHPDIFSRINHRHLPTIYPPVAQAAFAASAWFGTDRAATPAKAEASVRRWKILCGSVELLLWLLLFFVYGEQGKDPPRWLALWTLSPLPAVEIWLNGHLDGLGLLFLAAAILALRRQRAALLGAFIVLASLVKPLGVVLLPGLPGSQAFLGRRKRLWLLLLGGLLAAGLCFWPYRAAGLQVMPSLGEYGRRWRINDGAYALVHRGVERVVAATYRPPYYEPWRSKRLARLITGRDRDTVYPDELSNFFARGIVAGGLLGLLCWGLLRRLTPPQLGLLLLSSYALLTPVLHPWYLLWPLLFAPLWLEAAAPVLVLVALSPLGYLPLPAEWAGGGHHETVWAPFLEHGAAWLAVGYTVKAMSRAPRKLLLDQTQRQ